MHISSSQQAGILKPQASPDSLTQAGILKPQASPDSPNRLASSSHADALARYLSATKRLEGQPATRSILQCRATLK